MNGTDTKVFTDKVFLGRISDRLDALKASAAEGPKAQLAQSAFNKAIELVKYTGKLHALFLSDELFSGFMGEFDKRMAKTGASPAVIRNYRGGLRFIRDKIVLTAAFQHIQKLHPSRMAGKTIAEALTVLNEHFEPHMSMNQFTEHAAAVTGINVGSLRNWVYNGGQPKSQFRPHFAKLEARYQLREGLLQSKCALAKAVVKKKTGEREKLVASIELPEHVVRQIAEVANFKVTGRVPRRQAAFETDPDLPIEVRGGKKWSLDGDNHCASAVMFSAAVARYMTWLHHTKGVALADLDLGLLVRLRLLKDYKDAAMDSLHGSDDGTAGFSFMGVQMDEATGDRFPVSTSSVQQLLQLVRGMAGPSGFLSNHFKPADVPYDNWFKEQVALESNLKVWLPSLKQDGVKARQALKAEGRDDELVGGSSNIEPLLALGPEAALEGWKAIGAALMEAARYKASSVGAVSEQALSHALTGVWMAMALEQPLRAKNWAKLMLASEPCATGERLVKTGGAYTLHVPAVCLKNRRGTVSVRAISHTFQPSTCKVIDEYLAIRAARLKAIGVADHGYFLITPRNGAGTHSVTANGKENCTVACLIKRQTGRMMLQMWPDQGWPTSVGINMHACRHAVAGFTEHVTGDVLASAAVLGDSPQTTIMHYRDNTGMASRKAVNVAALLAGEPAVRAGAQP